MRSKYFTNYGASFKETVIFELLSLYGRTFRKRKTKLNLDRSPLLIDIGCGPHRHEGFVHADFFSKPWFVFWINREGKLKPDVELDLRYPLNCPDNVVDGYFSSHTLEHLYPAEAFNLVSEMQRTLKPGAWVRIAVPDLYKYIKVYHGEELHERFNEFASGCEAVSNATQNYGHHSSWDKETLALLLKETGFVNIRVVEYGKEGADKRLIQDDMPRGWESIAIEGQKPA